MNLAVARWRLVLGRFSQESLGNSSLQEAGYARMEEVLEYLYGREYQQRGTRPQDEPREAGLTSHGLSVPEWIQEARDLFPQSTVEVLEKHALERYGLTELVTDARVLEKLEPSYELLKTLLSFRHLMQGRVLEVARRLIRKVVDELRERLARELRPVLWGPLSRRHRSPLKVARNLDVKKTIRDNLKHFDPERRQLVLGTLTFFSRVRRHLPWHIIMAVDCSGSMLGSVIHSAVMAGIFAGLPAVKVSLVAFDTRIVDLSEHVDDPCEVLMSVQLGGGTTIGRALNYCEQLVVSPTRTLLVLVTDFFEGDDPSVMLSCLRRLAEAGVRGLGLAALDESATPIYDKSLAQQCLETGLEVGAMTPQHLGEWLGRVMQ